MQNRYESVAQKILEKFRRSMPMAAQAGIIPYKSENGQ